MEKNIISIDLYEKQYTSIPMKRIHKDAIT